MKSVLCISMLSLVMAATAVAQTPTVPAAGIVNSASYAPVGLPNSFIAQGSFFTIFGTNLGPASSPPIAYPLPTTLGGTTVKVTAVGNTINAFLWYVSPGQVNAILPQTVPTGTASLTVTYNNATSTSASFQVVASSFGIFTANSAGSGPGIITDANYKLNTQSSSAHPGDAMILWGTGLGISPGDDGTKPPTQTDLTSVPVTVYVGTQSAKVLYRGRAPSTAEDQINFVVPSGVTGCHVSVAVQIGNIVSNFVTMAIASSGSVCSDPTGPTPTDLTNFLLNGGSFGSVTLIRSTTTSAGLPPPFGTGQPTTSTTDSGSASFFKYTAQQLNLAQNPLQTFTIGSCIVYVFSGQGGRTTDPITPVGLDAGNQITVNGPNGIKQLTPVSLLGKGYYGATLGGGTPPNNTPLYLDAGSYGINGPGGADVGVFSFNLVVPPNLTWTNMSSIDTITRANGQLVTWTGGDPNGNVTITGFSFKLGTNANGSDSVGATFICTARDSDLQFTIPAPVLLSLPPSAVISPIPGISIATGQLSISSSSLPVKFTAPGLDYGYGLTSVSSGKSVTYQ
jgi:uncharacterized protein (TIGR03437 family)